MVRHRIGPERRLRIARHESPHFHLVAVFMIFGRDVEVAESDLIVLRNIDLDVLSGTELQCLAHRQFHNEFLDKSRDVIVRNHLAFPLLDPKHRISDPDLQVLLHFDLTAQTPFFSLLAPGKKVHLGRKYLTASV